MLNTVTGYGLSLRPHKTLTSRCHFQWLRSQDPPASAQPPRTTLQLHLPTSTIRTILRDLQDHPIVRHVPRAAPDLAYKVHLTGQTRYELRAYTLLRTIMYQKRAWKTPKSACKFPSYYNFCQNMGSTVRMKATLDYFSFILWIS